MPHQTMNTLAVVFAVVALTPVVVDLLRRWVAIPSVVLEIALGIVVGPQVLGLGHDDTIITFVADIGLALLMFLAGYEIDFDRIRGAPVKLAGLGWLSVVIFHSGARLAGGIWMAIGRQPASGLIFSFL